MTYEPRLVWPVGAELGEGPVWCAEDSALRFVDIKRGRLHRYDPATSTQETQEVGGEPSFILPTADGGFIVGSGDKLYRSNGLVLGDPVARVTMPERNRTNDASVDASGRLWFGTMDNDEKQPSGRLYCLDQGRLHPTDWTAVVTNGPAISSADRFLYLVDSGQRTIWRIPLQDGQLAASGEVFMRLGDDDGFPDGAIVDSEDCLWVALWDGWAVRRYAPDGTLLLQVDLPCARPTKIALGGPDLTTAFVTTARVGLDQTQLAAQPLAGGLFAFEAPAPGRILPPVRLA